MNQRLKTFAISIIVALFLALIFWIVDGILGYVFFRERIRYLIFEEPLNVLDSILLAVPPHDLFVRCTFLLACIVAGIIVAIVINQWRKTEAIFKNFFQQANVGFAIISKNKNFLKVNKEFIDMLGYSEKEMYTKTWEEITHPNDLEKELTLYNRLLKGAINSYEIEKKLYRKDKKIINTHLSMSAYKPDNKNISFLIKTVIDISKRKKAVKALRKSEKDLQKRLREIEQINKVMVGRELKMLELKEKMKKDTKGENFEKK